MEEKETFPLTDEILSKGIKTEDLGMVKAKSIEIKGFNSPEKAKWYIKLKLPSNYTKTRGDIYAKGTNIEDARTNLEGKLRDIFEAEEQGVEEVKRVMTRSQEIEDKIFNF